MEGLRIECNLCGYIGVSGQSAHDCNPARQIRVLRAKLAEVTRERDGLKKALAPFVCEGIEQACEECGGDDSECPPSCAIRVGRKALELQP